MLDSHSEGFFLVLLGTSIVDQVFVPSFTFNSIGLIGEKGSDLEP
jgi:hypothetical protein